jgi:glucose-6-phosphate 1-dehydrogenase
LGAWRDSGERPKPYTAGTWGPSAAIAMIERDGRTWHEDESAAKDADPVVLGAAA